MYIFSNHCLKFSLYLRSCELENRYREIKTPMKIKNVIIFWAIYVEEENIPKTDSLIMVSLVWGCGIT